MDIKELRKQVGLRIKVRRVELEMYQSDLAKCVGMRQPQISEIERGDRPMRVEQLMGFAKALKCTASLLLGERQVAA